ncbi:MAG: energy-coupling factor transporter transmembrane component T [Lachnospiraceae bacterium]
MSRIRTFTDKIDLRGSFSLVLFAALAVLAVSQEISYVVMLLLAAIWLCFLGKPGKALRFLAAYGVLYGISYGTLGVRGLETLWLFSNVLRHMLIPIAFTSGITEAPTGTLLAVFSKLRLHKAFGISTVVLLRFLPTITHELMAIHSSLKYRGVGTGFWNTLLHLPVNFELTIVPLLLRTTRIAEELSAAALVRGVRLNNDIISFEEEHFKKSDLGLIVLLGGLLGIVWVADLFSWWGMSI